ARDTLSRSPVGKQPASFRLRTISRIASSFPVACMSPRIAPRTTKSESFIPSSIDMPTGRRTGFALVPGLAPRHVRSGLAQPYASWSCSARNSGPGGSFRGSRRDRSVGLRCRRLDFVGGARGNPLVSHIPLVALKTFLVLAQLMFDLVDA